MARAVFTRILACSRPVCNKPNVCQVAGGKKVTIGCVEAC